MPSYSNAGMFVMSLLVCCHFRTLGKLISWKLVKYDHCVNQYCTFLRIQQGRSSPRNFLNIHIQVWWGCTEGLRSFIFPIILYRAGRPTPVSEFSTLWYCWNSVLMSQSFCRTIGVGRVTSWWVGRTALFQHLDLIWKMETIFGTWIRLVFIAKPRYCHIR